MASGSQACKLGTYMFRLRSPVEICLRKILVVLELGLFAVCFRALLICELVELGKDQSRTLGELHVTHSTTGLHASLEFIHAMHWSFTLGNGGGQVNGGVYFGGVRLPGEDEAVQSPRLEEVVVDTVQEGVLSETKLESHTLHTGL